jgi:hypothetical protein
LRELYPDQTAKEGSLLEEKSMKRANQKERRTRLPEKRILLLRRALASAEKTFGPGPPSIARSQSNLAMVLTDLGSWRKRVICCEKTHRVYLSRFGPDHPGTQTIRRNLEGFGN